MSISNDQAAAFGSPHAIHEDAFTLLPYRRPIDTAAGAEDPLRPSALIIFPAPSADRCRAMAALLAETTGRLVEEVGPILDVAVELLGLNDAVFTARLRDLRGDPIGRALLSELVGSLQSTSADLDRAGRAIFVIHARITAGLGNAGGADVR